MLVDGYQENCFPAPAKINKNRHGVQLQHDVLFINPGL